MDEDEFTVEGYIACGCGAWLPNTELRPAPSMCPDCQADLRSQLDGQRFRYEVQGRILTANDLRAKPRPTKVYPKTEKNIEDRRKLDRARMRAFVRLSHVYWPMFEMILNEEKLREGLKPDSRRLAPRPRAVARELLRDLEEAEERNGRVRQGAEG